MEQRLQNLQSQISDLTIWMNSQKNSLNFPLDPTTKKIIQDNFLVTTGTVRVPYFPSYNTSVEVSLDGVIYWVSAIEI